MLKYFHFNVLNTLNRNTAKIVGILRFITPNSMSRAEERVDKYQFLESLLRSGPFSCIYKFGGHN